MEKVWLAATILLVIVLTYMSITDGVEKWAVSFVLPAITFFAFITRRFLRKKLESNQRKSNERK